MGFSGQLYYLFENFRFIRVILNGKISSWNTVLTGVPQGSIFGPLLFLIYINDLPNELKSNVKLYADNTSLFTVVNPLSANFRKWSNTLSVFDHFVGLALKGLSIRMKVLMFSTITFSQPPHGLIIGKYFLIQILVNRIKKCCFQKKKKKRKIQVHPSIRLNNVQVERVSYQKHLGILLDDKVNFKRHIDSTISRVNKGISIRKNFYLPRHNLPRK